MQKTKTHTHTQTPAVYEKNQENPFMQKSKPNWF